MRYWIRISGALLASIVVNLLLLAEVPRVLQLSVASARTQPSESLIRFNLGDPAPPPDREPEPDDEDPLRLIDPGAAAEGPVADTDLISSRASQAQDNSDSNGDPTKPAVDELGDFDQMPALPSAPVENPEPVPAPVATPPADVTDVSQETPTAESDIASEPEPQPDFSAATQPEPAVEPPSPVDGPPAERGTQVAAARAEPLTADPPPLEPNEPTKVDARPQEEPKPAETPERFKVAAATPQPAKMPVQELKTSRGREEGGALKSGFTSFEANRHELGEYMLHVRSLVEREWRAALRIRYTGVSRTEAIIECSIRPDGTLEYARVVDAGVSLTYAVLCRQAIEQAAPFGPFPFDVPEIYRKDNLEITWRFSYM